MHGNVDGSLVGVCSVLCIHVVDLLVYCANKDNVVESRLQEMMILRRRNEKRKEKKKKKEEKNLSWRGRVVLNVFF